MSKPSMERRASASSVKSVKSAKGESSSQPQTQAQANGAISKSQTQPQLGAMDDLKTQLEKLNAEHDQASKAGTSLAPAAHEARTALRSLLEQQERANAALQKWKEDSTAPKKDAKEGKSAETSKEGAGEKKLSGKELKALKAAEKQAKRAAQKGGAGAPPQVAVSQSGEASTKGLQQGQGKKEQKSSSSAQAKSSQQQKSGAPAVQPPHPHPQANMPPQPQRQRRPSQAVPVEKLTPKSKPKQPTVPLFDHLTQTRRHAIPGTSKDVHPAILALGLQYSRYEICGSTARVLAMLLAFKAVVADYLVPTNQHISRHFTPHVLSPQIEFLKQCRPISISMGNAIRYLKEVVASMSPEGELADAEEAKKVLGEWIDNFIREKIQAADALIAEEASSKIVDGDVILVYGKSSVVLKTLLLAAKAKRKSFKVVVVDSKPLFEGEYMARDLAAAGFQDVEYIPLSSVSHCRGATKLILGAHAMMTNGRLFSRVGTALVAMTARLSLAIPVMVLCSALKFADRAPLDSILFNETANPLDLLMDGEGSKQWEEERNLSLLNLMYDVTPAEYLTAIYTEHGVLPPSSVPAMLRLLEDAGKSGGM